MNRYTAALAIITLAIVVSACSVKPATKSAINLDDVQIESVQTEPVATGSTVTEEGGAMEVTELTVGTGATVKSGDTVKVHYTGTLVDGTVFDSSVGKEPVSFPIGIGRVIQGWDQGIPGMKVGGKRKLVIPPELGYGSGGVPQAGIPGGATLVFEVELLAIE